MGEFIYVSEAKLAAFSRASSPLGLADRELEVNVPGLGSGRVGEQSAQAQDWSARLAAVVRQLENSDRRPRSATDPRIGRGDYIRFEGELRWAHFHRDNGAFEEQVVLFRGVSPDVPPRSDNPFGFTREHVTEFRQLEEVRKTTHTELFLGGWVGHMVDQLGVLPTSQRLGSDTEDLYRLWWQVAELDRLGSGSTPEAFGRLGTLPSSEMPGRNLADEMRSVWDMGVWQDPTRFVASRVEQAYVRVVARVGDILVPGARYRRLILGTPLYVEYAARPEPAPDDEPRGRWSALKHALRRSKREQIEPGSKKSQRRRLDPPRG